jgi:DHA1 family tetracycline resistance protein-like MFS transporter
MASDRSRLSSRLGVVFLTVFLDLVGFGLVIPILPLYAEQMHARDIEIGWLVAIYSIMQLFFAPIWGHLSDRVGRRPIMLVSIAGSCMSQLGYALAPSLGWLIAARALAGVCGANIAAAQAYVADVTSDEDRARGMGTLGAALGLGFVLGPAVGGALAHRSAQLPFFVAAALAAMNFVLAVVLLTEPRPRGERTHARTLSWDGVVRSVSQPRLGWAIALFFVVTFGFANLEATFSIYLERRFGYGRGGAALMFTYIGFFIIVVQGGLVRRLVPRFGERRLVIAGTAIMATGLLLLAWATTLSVLLIALAITAIGNAINTPSLSALISRLAGEDEQGGVLGVSQAAGALARVTGPLVGTAVLAAFGLRAPYHVGAAVLAVASLVAIVAVQQPTARIKGA